jgi:hypothetical protein
VLFDTFVIDVSLSFGPTFALFFFILENNRLPVIGTPLLSATLFPSSQQYLFNKAGKVNEKQRERDATRLLSTAEMPANTKQNKCSNERTKANTQANHHGLPITVHVLFFLCLIRKSKKQSLIIRRTKKIL